MENLPSYTLLKFLLSILPSFNICLQFSTEMEQTSFERDTIGNGIALEVLLHNLIYSYFSLEYLDLELHAAATRFFPYKQTQLCR